MLFSSGWLMKEASQEQPKEITWEGLELLVGVDPGFLYISLKSLEVCFDFARS